MFSIVNGNGNRTEYVPGAFRSRRVQPIFPAGPVRKVAAELRGDEEPEPNTTSGDSRGRAQSYPRGADVLEREAALVARQIMSRPLISLEEGVSTAKAWELVLERRFRHVPVRTEGGRITGILSDRDLLRWQARSEGSEIPIREIMTTPVLVAHPDAEIRLVARVLFEEHIGAMPIIDEQSIPVGILTRSDILRAVIQRAPLQLWI